MKPNHRVIPFVALFTGACSFDIVGDDPRVGDNGRVALRGDGCASSNVMAVGSRASLRIESATEQSIPADLEVTSSAPEVIELTAGASNEITLVARAAGESYLAVTDRGLLFDGLSLYAAPATIADSDHPDRVLEGGRIDFIVTSVYGPCPHGGLCELFGDDFLTWTAEPEDAFWVASEQSRRISYTAQASGRIVAREPARGAALIAADVEVVASEAITGFSARLLTVPSDGSLPQGRTLPAAIPPSDRLCLILDAERNGKAIPVSRFDVEWELEGAVTRPSWGSNLDEAVPLCTVVQARQPGEAVLRASSSLFDERPSFELTVR